MARQIITLVLCDVCLSHDAKTEGEEIPATTIGQLKPRVLALCEPHRKEFFDPFNELLREMGQPADIEAAPMVARSKAAADDDGKFACPVCGRRVKHLAPHGFTQHGLTAAQVDAAVRGEQPNLLSEVEEFNVQRCDQPGCDKYYAEPRHSRPVQALAVHKRMKHGINGPHAK